MAVRQKQINVTRKREAVFTGNHAVTRRRQKGTKGRRTEISPGEGIRCQCTFDAFTPTTEWTSCRTARTVPPLREKRNRIQWGTIVIYLPRRVLARVQRPTWPRLFIKSVPNRAPCWALTRPVSLRCAIRNGEPLFHEQRVKRTRRRANDIDSQPTCKLIVHACFTLMTQNLVRAGVVVVADVFLCEM